MSSSNRLPRQWEGRVLINEEDTLPIDVRDRANRSWLCSVLFLDIVSYSQTSLAHQSVIKKTFNDALQDSLRPFSPDSLVILDTGDGAAVCFLGDPEEAFLAATTFVTRINEKPILDNYLPLVRLGINLGPVKLVKDLNGNVNALGDGINVAQRIMSFSEPNQILLSRSYYEVIICISDDYKSLFSYEGVRKDKHIREHAIYSLSPKKDPLTVVALETQALPTASERQILVYSQELSIQLANFLKPLIGPIAPVIIKKAFKTQSNWSDVVTNLEESIPLPADRDIFRTNVRRIPPNLLPRMEVTTMMEEPPSISTETTEVPASNLVLPADLQQKLERELAHYIGPMAKIMIRKTCAKVKDYRELLQHLSEQIPNPEDQKKFRTKLKA